MEYEMEIAVSQPHAVAGLPVLIHVALGRSEARLQWIRGHPDEAMPSGEIGDHLPTFADVTAAPHLGVEAQSLVGGRDSTVHDTELANGAKHERAHGEYHEQNHADYQPTRHLSACQRMDMRRFSPLTATFIKPFT